MVAQKKSWIKVYLYAKAMPLVPYMADEDEVEQQVDGSESGHSFVPPSDVLKQQEASGASDNTCFLNSVILLLCFALLCFAFALQ